MGLPAYIINREELQGLIIKALGSVSLKAGLAGATITADSLDIDFTPVEEALEELLASVSDQSISSNSLYMAIANVSAEAYGLQALYEENAYGIKSEADKLLKENERIQELLKLILDFLSVSGRHRTTNLHSVVPGTAGTYYLRYTAPSEMRVTSVFSYQTSYDYADSWDLRHNGRALFSGIHSKRTPERKNFSSHLKLSQGDTLEILFHNSSGKPKTINYDIDFLAIG
jgi:hypothetical protein